MVWFRVRVYPLWVRYAVAIRFDIESVHVCIVRSTVFQPPVSPRYRLPYSSLDKQSVYLHFLGWPGEALRGCAGLL